MVVAALWPEWCWWRHCGRVSFGGGTVAEGDDDDGILVEVEAVAALCPK